MMSSKSVVFTIALGLVILSADGGRAADNERGAQLAAMCASCHRLDGEDKGVPAIVGMDNEKLAEAMAAFSGHAFELDHARGSLTAQRSRDSDPLDLAARAKESKRQ